MEYKEVECAQNSTVFRLLSNNEMSINGLLSDEIVDKFVLPWLKHALNIWCSFMSVKGKTYIINDSWNYT